MSNSNLAKATRGEEIAFLAMERIPGVNIELADADAGAGAGAKMPDDRWKRIPSEDQDCVVEVTSPPASHLTHERAHAKIYDSSHVETGSYAPRLNDISQVCAEMMHTVWAKENFCKFLAQPARERQLFLFARRHSDQSYFRRLSGEREGAPDEDLQPIQFPHGTSDVWFRGQATRVGGIQGLRLVKVARYQAASGWHSYEVNLQERELPAPARGIADDQVELGWRCPKDRGSLPTME